MEVARVTAHIELEGMRLVQEFVLEYGDGGFGYGNRTSVRRRYPDGAEECYDTRYDTTIRRDGSNFGQWVEGFLRSRNWARPLVGVVVR